MLKLLDEKILLAVQRWRSPIGNRFFWALTLSGTGRAWFAMALVFNVMHFLGINFIRDQRNFLHALFGPLVAWLASSALKKIIGRKRPSSAIQGFESIVPAPECGSFPSGHAAASFAFFVSLSLVGHPIALYVGIWAVLVSFSRLYLGVHYLSDILAGFIVGLVSAGALAFF